jgi:hypothetical protein
VHPCTLSPSKLLGTPSLTPEGCNACRGVITSGVETRGGMTLLLPLTHDGYKLV